VKKSSIWGGESFHHSLNYRGRGALPIWEKKRQIIFLDAKHIPGTIEPEGEENFARKREREISKKRKAEPGNRFGKKREEIKEKEGGGLSCCRKAYTPAALLRGVAGRRAPTKKKKEEA